MTQWMPDLEKHQGPRYRAIAQALGDDIASGKLPAGTRLPTHRELAYQLGVTVGTITRAYAEAEKRGLIGGEVGRGTFVQGQRPDPGQAGVPAWDTQSRPSTVNMTALRADHTEASHAIGPTLAAIAASGLAGQLMDYAPHAGFPAHRAAGAQWLTRQHRAIATADSVLLTTGAQNGLAVALAAVARPGDVVLTERLANYGMKALAATQGYHLEGVALDEHGIVPGAFDSACRRLGPKAAYLVPTIQNPTGAFMPTERRKEIVEIARRYDVLLIEDDVFGFMIPDAVPIQAIAPDITVYISSLSKSVSAGLRIGYVVAPPALVPRIGTAIHSLQYSVPGLPAEVATRWINDGSADRFAEAQRAEDVARQAIARAILPSKLVCGHPMAQHLWLLLPEPWGREDFVSEVRRRGVMVLGADTFAVGRTGTPHAVRVGLRLPRTREEVERGARILADTLAQPLSATQSIV